MTISRMLSAKRPAENETNGGGTENGGEGVRADELRRGFISGVHVLDGLLGGRRDLIDLVANRIRRRRPLRRPERQPG